MARSKTPDNHAAPRSDAGRDEVAQTVLPDRLLPLSAVTKIAGLGKTMIYRLMREDKFPLAYKPGGVSSRWSERELTAWLATVAAQRRLPDGTPKR